MSEQRSDSIQSSNDNAIEKENASHPAPVRRKEDQSTETRSDLPGDAVTPGLNEATDDPN
jgi:hypothetical protein